MLDDKPAWIKLLVVCVLCLVIVSILGILLSTFI